MLIVRGEHFFPSGDRMLLDYGQAAKGSAPNPEMQQASIAIDKMKSTMEALNYLSSQGWECINVSTLAGATGDTGYLLRRAK